MMKNKGDNMRKESEIISDLIKLLEEYDKVHDHHTDCSKCIMGGGTECVFDLIFNQCRKLNIRV